eukprot:1303924-Rhodomonas_salina.3
MGAGRAPVGCLVVMGFTRKFPNNGCKHILFPRVLVCSGRRRGLGRGHIQVGGLRTKRFSDVWRKTVAGGARVGVRRGLGDGGGVEPVRGGSGGVERVWHNAGLTELQLFEEGHYAAHIAPQAAVPDAVTRTLAQQWACVLVFCGAGRGC